MALPSSLPSAVPPQPLCHRFFFALKPDEETARQTHMFALAELGARGFLPPEHHHVTLALVEDMDHPDPAMIAALHRAGARVRAAPFKLCLDRMVATHRTVSLRPAAHSAPLEALQTAVAAALAGEDIALRVDWCFDPHETLAYRKGEPGLRVVPGFCWSVSAFMLIHSHVGLHRHETIGRWSLAGETAAA